MPGKPASAGQSICGLLLGRVLVAGDERDGAGQPRWVTGIPAYAGAAMPAVTPGTTSNASPAARSACASSPPRPKTNGSPPFRRTTERPARACSTSRRVVSSWGTCSPPPTLPTSTSSASRAHAGQRLGRDEPVVQDHVGAGQQLERARREQPGVAGPGADEVGDARSRAHVARSRTSSAPAASRRCATSAPERLGVVAGQLVAQPGEPSARPTNARRRQRAAVGGLGVRADRRVAVGLQRPDERALGAQRRAASARRPSARAARRCVVAGAGLERPASPWPAAGTIACSVEHAGHAVVAAPGAAARRAPGRSRRSRPRPAGAGACRRCRAARRPRGPSRRARSWAARRRLLVPTRAPRGSASSEAAPHRASRGSARARGRGDHHARPARWAGTSLAECTARSMSPAQQRLVDLLDPALLVAGAAGAVARRRDRDELGAAERLRHLPGLRERQRAPARPDPHPLPRRLSGRTVPGAAVAGPSIRARRPPAARTARAGPAGARGRPRPRRPSAGSSARAAGAASRRGRRPRCARRRAATRSPSARRSRPGPAPRSPARARAGPRSWASRRARPSSARSPGSPARRSSRPRPARPRAPRGCAPRRAAGRRCRRPSRPSSSSQACSMSRGTAMSMKSSGRWSRARMTTSRSSRLDQRVRRRRSRRRRCRPRPGGRAAPAATRPGPRSARPARARARRGGWRRRSWSRPGRPARGRSARSSRPAPMITTLRCARSPMTSRASSTATVEMLARPAPSAVSVRTRLPVWSAARKRRFVSGPVVPPASACS